jgi:hypothetical protein
VATASPPKLAVLLGAGASAKAGVPTTLQFVKEFRDSLSGSSALLKVYDGLVRRLKQAAAHGLAQKLVDVEAVLDTLETLRNPSVVDRAIATRARFGHSADNARLDVIRKRLQEFIRKRCLVEFEKTEYLLPLIQLSNAFHPLPIFTVNYDVVVEQFLEGHGLNYVDGFELRFDPNSFGSLESDVLLYKLHGSVTWFRSQTGGYLKLPVKSSLRHIDLLSGERAEPVMLYPAQKADYAGPFLELFRSFQDTLRHAEWLLVLGYSFRDPLLLDVVLDAAVSNPNLKVVLVCGRRTERIFEQSLGPRVSSLPNRRNQRGAVIKDRIIRLPYRVEDSLQDFLVSIFPALQKATVAHTTSIWAELHGEPGRWAEAAEHYLRAGATAQGTSLLLEHVAPGSLSDDQRLRYYSLAALALSAAAESVDARRAWNAVVDQLRLMLVHRVYPMLGLRPPRLSFVANWHRGPGGGHGGFDYRSMGTQVSEIAHSAEVILRCLGGNPPTDTLRPTAARLGKLARYLEGVPQNGFDLNSYIADRSADTPRWLRPLARRLTGPSVDLSKAGQEIAKLETGLATTELRYIEREFLRGL